MWTACLETYAVNDSRGRPPISGPAVGTLPGQAMDQAGVLGNLVARRAAASPSRATQRRLQTPDPGQSHGDKSRWATRNRVLISCISLNKIYLYIIYLLQHASPIVKCSDLANSAIKMHFIHSFSKKISEIWFLLCQI